MNYRDRHHSLQFISVYIQKGNALTLSNGYNRTITRTILNPPPMLIQSPPLQRISPFLPSTDTEASRFLGTVSVPAAASVSGTGVVSRAAG